MPIRFYVTAQLSENWSETPEGYLLIQNVPITRTGEFVYRQGEIPVEANASGEIRILRDEEEVFRPETIASFEGKSVTINHPDGAVDPTNWQELTVGTGQNVRRGEGDQSDLMLADLLVTTEEAIAAIRAGLREISCGYDADYEQIEPGLGRQRNIVGNHIALVMRGRAGSRCAIGDKVCTGCGNCGCNKNNEHKEVAMPKKGFFKKAWSFFKDASEAEMEKLDEEMEKKESKDAEELPVKLKEITDKWAGWAKDVSEGKLDIGQLPVELKEVKDKKSKDEEEEETGGEKKVDPESEKIEQDKKSKDADEIAGLKADIAELKEVVQELVESDAAVHASMDKKKAKDKKAKDADEDDPEGKEKKDEEKTDDAEGAEESEKAEKAEEEKEATKDVAENWVDIASRVEILCGAAPRKPTKDFAESLRKIKVNALRDAITADADAVKPFTFGKEPEELTKDRLDAAFIGVSELIAAKNNSRVHTGKYNMTSDRQAANTAAAINQKNKEFYGKK